MKLDFDVVLRHVELPDVVEVDGHLVYRRDAGSMIHGQPCATLYVAADLPVIDRALALPARGVDLVIRDDAHIVVRGPYTLFGVYVRAGYRGLASYAAEHCLRHVTYQIYHSPRGNLGVSVVGLVLCEVPEVVIRWRRTGRTYGWPTYGRVRITADGQVEDVNVPADLADILKTHGQGDEKDIA